MTSYYISLLLIYWFSSMRLLAHRLLAALVVATGVMMPRPAEAARLPSNGAELIGLPAYAPARNVAAWIMRSHDSGGLQFIIIDKVNARLFLFAPDGSLQASTPVLLGLARGDVSPPGIGERKLSAIAPAERITPAGRFVTHAGNDVGGRDLVWIDYDAAVALHRASDRKPGMGVMSRVARLAAPSALDRRVSLGCVNVSTPFYDRYIEPTFGTASGIIYILPETHSATVEFHMYPPTDQPARILAAAAPSLSDER